MTSPDDDAWVDYVGHWIVLDMCSPYVYLGRLSERRGTCLILEDVDVHDLRDTTTTREKYVVDSRMHGIRSNRRRTMVRLEDVVGVSRLDDVVVD